jgi:hypothetical protein
LVTSTGRRVGVGAVHETNGTLGSVRCAHR